MATLFVGVCMAASPWFSGASTNEASFANAWLAGLFAIMAASWALFEGESRSGTTVRLGIGVWLLASPFVLGFTESGMAWHAWLSGAMMVALADTPSLAFDLQSRLRARRLSRQIHAVSPQEIVEYVAPEEHSPNPERLSRQIVERACRIHHTLQSRPSDAEVEMCGLGYRVCADDMITLVRLIDKELPEAGLIRRLRLVFARAGAARSLSRVRGMLPRKPRRSSPRGEGIA
ncbi:MAG: SPW repeat protein [Actinomycetota bacterium]|nr:SPW repeat protein [Rubrobacter sp.]MDQ3509222.1 SPW repeat protein [Actinomycetota bacterium]